MRSQFKESLSIDPTTGNVDAEGSFAWGPDEEKAVVAVSIFQELGSGQLTKSGAGKGTFMKTGNPDGWSLKVDSEDGSNQLTATSAENPALAMGVVCALGKDIEMRQFMWCEEVELT